jgi:uncharacterized YccA/Bax inhibitor family protein
LIFAGGVLDFRQPMNGNFSNPILSRENFSSVGADGSTTLAGTVNRCLILLALVFGAAGFAWFAPGATVQVAMAKATTFLLIGFVVAIVTMWKKEWAAATAPLYAVCEGLFLGAFSRVFEFFCPGIVAQAIFLTFGVAFGVLLLYKSGVIRVTNRFAMIIGAAMFGVCLLYIADLILSIFGIHIPLLISNGVGGIVFSAFVVVIAALSLAMDFECIVQVSARGLPVYMSWFAAFGLASGLILLYIRILDLLLRLRNRS